MGMYTELVIKCTIKENLPKEVEDTLQYLFSDGECPEFLPTHPFFLTSRWVAIGKCSSYYHIPKSYSYYKEGYLFSRSDLKNYSGEIELFFDWLDPYIAELTGKCVGWKWYEEYDVPELVYKK